MVHKFVLNYFEFESYRYVEIFNYIAVGQTLLLDDLADRLVVIYFEVSL